TSNSIMIIVGYIGSDLAIKNCRILIERIRELFPHLKSIGWLALSPRSKPSKLFNSITINEKYQEFNQYLKKLSKEMNFEIINANLQHQHMHYDGLHPSIQSGRVLIEKALYNWFVKQIKQFSITSHHHHHHHTTVIANHHLHNQTTTAHNNNNNNNNCHHHNHTTTNHNRYNHATATATNICHHHNSTTTTNNNNNNRTINNNNSYNKNTNNRQKTNYKLKENLNNLPSKSLIPYYPHFLRHKQEFFRKITIPIELENKKEDIYNLSNIHYQTEYYKFESEKWKVYTIAANKKKQIEPMDTIIEINESLPVARPSPAGLSRPPAALELTEFSEFFDEWLPEPTPGQKRKLGHRRDDPPTPPSPRQPPPIIPRKTLPPRNPNVPLTGGSLHASPMSNNNHEQQQQYSFNVLFPSEKENQREQHTETANLIVAQENEPSMIISPILNSTPERIIRTPSVIPKNGSIPHSSFEYAIIPIECRYYFKRMREKCTFEIIKAHQEFLENKYKTLENEREKMLYSLFPNQVRAQVVEFIKNITEKSLDRKKKDNQKRLDNLLLDQMREKATFEIKRTATSVEQEYIQNAHEKFTRTLDLKLQLDKLEKRFVENMPPPSLNSFDKLQLHAKGLKSDDIHLSSLREQWKNVLRKTKLDLTALMREAKIRELEEANKEYEQLLKKLPDHFREPYDILCHVSGTRHSQFAKRKLNFLAKRACTMNEN
ncbi:unnamed protein product, partial [Rotaria sp. Silwood1]